KETEEFAGTDWEGRLESLKEALQRETDGDAQEIDEERYRFAGGMVEQEWAELWWRRRRELQEEMERIAAEHAVEVEKAEERKRTKDLGTVGGIDLETGEEIRKEEDEGHEEQEMGVSAEQPEMKSEEDPWGVEGEEEEEEEEEEDEEDPFGNYR
ncbi:hypothetical protein ADUPG1_000187, partial [Aduncisulcus paluster]